MACTQAEMHRLIDALEYELFEKDPKPKTVEEVRRRFDRVAGALRYQSVESLFRELGL